jgi:hypothetical protein
MTSSGSIDMKTFCEKTNKYTFQTSILLAAANGMDFLLEYMKAAGFFEEYKTPTGYKIPMEKWAIATRLTEPAQILVLNKLIRQTDGKRFYIETCENGELSLSIESHKEV